MIANGPRAVGALFFCTAAIKAIAPHTFAAHLRSLRLPGAVKTQNLVTAAAALEAAWAVALMLAVAPRLLYPATAMLLIVFSGITFWSVRTKRAADCGCYGGFVAPSLSQSILLNGLCIAICAAGWLSLQSGPPASTWKLSVAIAVGIVFGLFTWRAQLFHGTHGVPMVDLNPLKLDARWRHSWAAGATRRSPGEVLIAFLGPDCPYCTRFVKIANALIQSPGLPPVIGVVSVSEDRLGQFVAENDIRFPVSRISPSLMNRLVSSVPTVAVVESGRITDLWSGALPPAFLERVKKALFPEAARQPEVGASQSQS